MGSLKTNFLLSMKIFGSIGGGFRGGYHELHQDRARGGLPEGAVALLEWSSPGLPVPPQALVTYMSSSLWILREGQHESI